MQAFERGDLVWYRQRDGTFAEAKVVSVDKGVQPYSYGVLLGDAVRETEATRLTARTGPQPPPAGLQQQNNTGTQQTQLQQVTGRSHSAALAAESSEDDFGDFSGHEVVSETGAVPSHVQLHWPVLSSKPEPQREAGLPPKAIAHPGFSAPSTPTAHAAWPASQPGGTQLSQNGVAPLSGLANGTAVSSAADEEDDFGEFEDAASSFGAPSAAASSESARQSHLSAAHGHSQPQPSLTPPVTDRSAPLAMSLFGEEDATADQQLPSLAVGQPWGGLPSLPAHVATIQQAAPAPAFYAAPPQLPAHPPHSTARQQVPRAPSPTRAPPPATIGSYLPAAPHFSQLPSERASSSASASSLPAVNQQIEPVTSQPITLSLPLSVGPQPSAVVYAGNGRQYAPPLHEPGAFQISDHHHAGPSPQAPSRAAAGWPHTVSQQLPVDPFSVPTLSDFAAVDGLGGDDDDDDDFGDFAGAAASPYVQAGARNAPEVTLGQADRSLPIPASIFGEEEADESAPEDASALMLPLAWPPKPPAATRAPSVPQGLDVAFAYAEAADPFPQDVAGAGTYAAAPLPNGHPAFPDQGLQAASVRDQRSQALDAEAERQLLAARVQAWSQLLQICAEELELGRAIWEAHAARDSLEAFCRSLEGRQYLMSLGNVRFASCVLQSAMRQPSLEHSVREHRPLLVEAAGRCSSAWDAPTHGAFGMTLHQAACEACTTCGAPHLGPLLATASMDGTELEKLPEGTCWQPGRCAITLLPLQRLPSAPTTAFDEDLECLEALAQLWRHRVSDDVPQWISTR